MCPTLLPLTNNISFPSNQIHTQSNQKTKYHDSYTPNCPSKQQPFSIHRKHTSKYVLLELVIVCTSSTVKQCYNNHKNWNIIKCVCERVREKIK